MKSSNAGFDFAHASATVGLTEFQTWLNGVAAYQGAPMPVVNAPPAIVWQQGGTQVFDYSTTQSDTLMLVLPSLINQATVLDLLPDNSFMRTLGAQHAAWLIDWGQVGEAEKPFSVDDYVLQRVLPVIEQARVTHKKIILVGYCMGGLLALAAAAHTKVDGLVLMATPWDFYAYPMPARLGLAQMHHSFTPWMQAGNALTIDMLQTLFTLLQPMAVFEKFKKAGTQGFDETFVAIEDWLNDGVELPSKVAQTCLADWFQNNATYAGEWRVGGKIIHPEEITAPTLIIVPQNDKIVPSASALPLVDFMPNATLQTVPLGHVGMIVGKQGRAQVWPMVSNFTASIAAKTA